MDSEPKDLPAKRTIAGWLFNPFQFVAGFQALATGLIAILAAGAIGFLSHTHFDGVLDMHTGLSLPLWVFLAEGLVDWLCMAVVLLAAGALISKTRFRAIDILGTQALARWPAALSACAALAPGFRRYVAHLAWKLAGIGSETALGPTDVLVFGVVAVAILIIVCWMVLLMYRSYSVSFHVRGGKAIATFIIGLLLAEAASKAIILAEVASKAAIATQAAPVAPDAMAAPVAPAAPDAENAAVQSADAWLKRLDEGQYGASWDAAAALFQNAISRSQWEATAKSVRDPLGPVVSREIAAKQHAKTLPGAPSGEYVIIQYKTSFQNNKNIVETVTPMLDKDGQWRVSGYFVK